MALRGKSRRDQLGSTEQQAAQKWQPPPMVPHGRWKDPSGFDRPPAADPLAFTPKGAPGFEGIPWDMINAVRAGQLTGREQVKPPFQGLPGSPRSEGVPFPSEPSEPLSALGLSEDILNALAAYPAFSAGGGLLQGAKGLLGKGAKTAITPAQKIIQRRLNFFIKALDQQRKAIASNTPVGAVGKAASGFIDNSVMPRFAKGAKALNTKKAKLSINSLRKLGLSPVAIGLISGYLFSIPWSLNEKSDALTTLTINQRDAVTDKDFDTAQQYDDLIHEISDLTVMNVIENFIPFYNVASGTLDKFKATRLTSEKLMKQVVEQEQ